MALDPESGTELWRSGYEASAAATAHLDTTWGSGPNSTPIVSEGPLYTVGFTGKVHCFDAGSGRTLWSHDLAAQDTRTIPFFGLSTSPLIHDDLLIVVAGGGARAYELETGAFALVER